MRGRSVKGKNKRKVKRYLELSKSEDPEKESLTMGRGKESFKLYSEVKKFVQVVVFFIQIFSVPDSLLFECTSLLFNFKYVLHFFCIIDVFFI